MQVIIRDNKDLDARFDRAALYMDLGEPKKARSCSFASEYSAGTLHPGLCPAARY